MEEAELKQLAELAVKFLRVYGSSTMTVDVAAARDDGEFRAAVRDEAMSLLSEMSEKASL